MNGYPKEFNKINCHEWLSLKSQEDYFVKYCISTYVEFVNDLLCQPQTLESRY
jgi:hypothetical protein